MRTITNHHDGHGLAESLVITSDEPDQSGASHNYQVAIEIKRPGDFDLGRTVEVVGKIQYQKGPRNVEGSTLGLIDQALLGIIIDRHEGFQKGPYSCQANEDVITFCKSALATLKARADERAKRGVLGKNVK